MRYVAQLLYWITKAALMVLAATVWVLLVAMVAPFMAAAAAFRWIEFHAVYAGNRLARERTEWRSLK